MEKEIVHIPDKKISQEKHEEHKTACNNQVPLPICGSCHLFLPVNEYVQVPIRKADIEIMEKDRRRGVDADEGNGTTIHAPLLFSVLYDSWNLSSCGFFCLQKLSSYILKKKKSILHLTTIIDIINIHYNQANQRN